MSIRRPGTGRQGRIQPDAVRAVAGMSVAAVLAVACEGALRPSTEARESVVDVSRPAVPARSSRAPPLRLDGHRYPRRIHSTCYEWIVASTWRGPRSRGATGART